MASGRSRNTGPWSARSPEGSSARLGGSCSETLLLAPPIVHSAAELVEQKSKHAGLFHRHHPHTTEKSTPPHRKIMVTGDLSGVEPERRYTVFRGTVDFSRTPTTFQPTKVATSPCRLSFEVVPFRLFAVNRYYVTMVDTTNTAAVGSLCCLRSV